MIDRMAPIRGKRLYDVNTSVKPKRSTANWKCPCGAEGAVTTPHGLARLGLGLGHQIDCTSCGRATAMIVNILE